MRIFYILSFILISNFSFAQTDYQAEQRKLEQKKAAIQKEIKEVQALLNSNKKKERDISAEIANQSKKIKLQENLIANSQKQKKNLDNDIYVNTLAINKLKKELEILKADYAKTVLNSYKYKSDESKVLFILSSDNFLQAYKRIQYLKQYAQHRKHQVDEIQAKTNELNRLNDNISKQIVKQQAIIKEQEILKGDLEEDRRKQKQLMASVQKDSRKYSQDIKKKQQESRNIDAQIKRLIQKSIEEANRRAREKATREAKAKGKTVEAPKKSAPGKLDLTPEETLVANNFKANQGRLPWPVEKGYISMGYGKNRHPEHDNLEITNSGIDITTEKGASVRAVFEGEVMSVQVYGGQRAVAIRHGDYITVYSNLSSVSVSAGQKVSHKQRIGTVGTNLDKNPGLRFLVSHNTNILNPQSWISRR
ncbi:murein hydrolase activator EnvC [Capnocytophaga sp. ARDL2]|uniref:murein hydrolase activator EnvC family protein n=1 Tax=Capnocytophaga sp. ARDL2 TaxID=3238809 RepID=UPI003555ECE8